MGFASETGQEFVCVPNAWKTILFVGSDGASRSAEGAIALLRHWPAAGRGFSLAIVTPACLLRLAHDATDPRLPIARDFITFAAPAVRRPRRTRRQAWPPLRR